MRLALHFIIIIALTVATQIGGVIYFAAFMIGIFARKLFNAPHVVAVLLFLVALPGLWFGSYLKLVPMAAEKLAGTYPLPCYNTGGISAYHPIYCLTFRNYTSPNIYFGLLEVAEKMPAAPNNGPKILTMDAGFPFPSAVFPMLPHQGHREGNQVDLAVWYEGGARPSKFGYGAYPYQAPDGPPPCPADQPPGPMGPDKMPKMDPVMTGAAFAQMGTLSADRALLSVEAATHVYAITPTEPNNQGSIFRAPPCTGKAIADRIRVTGKSPVK